MNKWFPFAMIAVGVLLLFMGYRASNSANSVIDHILHGRPSNEAIWMMVAGGIALVGGLAYLGKGK